MQTNKLLSKILIIIFVLMTNNESYTQISKGGTPPSFSKQTLSDSVQIARIPAVNLDSILKKDTVNDFSFRFGYAIDVDLDKNNSGTWDTLQNGDKIWRLKIHSTGAYSINLIYDDFWLTDGAEFFVYNEDKTMILGAFTAEINNNPYNKFATDLVKGDVTILEYFEPAFAGGSKINIDKVIHAYKNTFSGHGESGSCNIDITCSQGNDWCIEKRATSMILVDNNTTWCSGCLVNNVRQDLTPYYLTANHCLRGDENTWIFRFKYWSPTCNEGVDATRWRSITGSNVRANHAGSDFALLELNTPPPSGFGVLYAGWDRTASPPLSGVGIHHPRGDVMKISLYGNQTVNAFVNDDGVNSWLLHFDQGVVEPGSSGSTLFNQNHSIVGQLFGTTRDNYLTCDNPNGDAVYGRFDISWNGGGTPQTRLRDWLDPDNTGATAVNATSPTIYLINRTLTGTHKFAALEDIHIEGNIRGLLCQPNNTPFTAEPGSNVEVKAKNITIKKGTHFKAGSNVTITATENINCSDNIVEGYYINVFCNVDINKKKTTSYTSNDDVSDIEKEKEKKSIFNISEHIKIYPNPTTGIFEIAFSDNYDKYSKILIYNATGKIVYQQNNITQNIIPIDICHLLNGVYIIQIMQDQNVYTQKIILH